MKSARDIPVGAAIVVSMLALIASVVAGREQQPAELEARAAAPIPALPALDLDLEKLARARPERAAQDLFPAERPPIPAAAMPPRPVEPPVPAAPPLPYSYLGRMQKGGQTIVYLLKNDELLLAESGGALSPEYRVQAVSDSAVEILYLPLGIVQVLRIPESR